MNLNKMPKRAYWLGKKRPPMTLEQKRKLSVANKGNPKLIASNLGKKHSLATRAKMSQMRMGHATSIETRKKIGYAHGIKKGWVTPVNRAIRGLAEYRLWRIAVFERDNYTCVWCKKRGGELNADHIKPFALFPELRFAIDNGRTLCVPCHRTTDTWGGRAKKTLIGAYKIKTQKYVW